MEENLRKMHYMTIALVYLEEDRQRGITEVRNMLKQRGKKNRFAQAERHDFLRQRFNLLNHLIKDAEIEILKETKKYAKKQLKLIENGSI